MAIQKTTFDLGVPWEDTAGYAQAVLVDNWLYISGQSGHRADGTLVSPAIDGQQGDEQSRMKDQMIQAYLNARAVLAHFDCTFDNVVEEVVFAVDIGAALAVMREVRQQFYLGDKPKVTNTIVGTPALPLPGQVVEIKFVARR
ncbi:RidA family protein [Asanoa sp. WMMD1127]|uniref:RidA family protein n=1 Tax=Asanoa sp. WMMD1127 TaxID=3016107 RepID=UPI0024178D28|nr:RidA family protein [Asanoa sp. WMMD1127]MDG4824973.1 RidA family protein [Asanoa sp. WMMD1127]